MGYEQLDNEVGTPVQHDKAASYKAPSNIAENSLAFGGTWNVHSQEATAGAQANLDLQFSADDVYLVMGGDGTVSVSENGRHLKTVSVSGIPKLYTLFSSSALESGLLQLSMSPGVQAYDFTFG